MDVLTVGPFAIPFGPLILMATLFIGIMVGGVVARSRKLDVEPPLWQVMLAGIITARIVFVISHFDAYSARWWTMFDIRDGGFTTSAGVAAAIVAAIVIWWRKRDLRKPFLVSVLAGGLFWTLSTVLMMAYHVEPMQLPELALPRLDGGAVRVDTLAGKPVVVNLWATWCPPCRREMPVLRDAQEKNKDITFVFANQGESAAMVSSYLKQEKLALSNVLLDPAMQFSGKLQSTAFPTTLFFDAQGKLVDRRMGELSAATLAERLEQLRAK
ncbi:TlpA disulfide reductase family protein [Oxalobacteraceae bacterium R-40]|uniref:TlpA disulfide reductase family protein n=1 Tax=Keguizhuia sedimenti TaxID=3064264 RepID=A0ABU1BTP9_9BURK|nr:TlpA disulfide reductase family protein [Oxalobacteraceae bacterium R-40]